MQCLHSVCSSVRTPATLTDWSYELRKSTLVMLASRLRSIARYKNYCCRILYPLILSEATLLLRLLSAASMQSAAHHPIDIWKSFTKLERDGKKLSKCNLCNSELSGWLAGNARKHLLTRHVADMLPHDAVEDNVEKRSAENGLKNEIEHLRTKVYSSDEAPLP